MLPSSVWQSLHLRHDTLVWGVHAEMSWRWLNVTHSIVPGVQSLTAQEGYWAKFVMQVTTNWILEHLPPPPTIFYACQKGCLSFIRSVFAYVWNISSIWKLIQYRIFLCFCYLPIVYYIFIVEYKETGTVVCYVCLLFCNFFIIQIQSLGWVGDFIGLCNMLCGGTSENSSILRILVCMLIHCWDDAIFEVLLIYILCAVPVLWRGEC
jgi:hypothetical protein